jgi:hypothetical protein
VDTDVDAIAEAAAVDGGATASDAAGVAVTAVAGADPAVEAPPIVDIDPQPLTKPTTADATRMDPIRLGDRGLTISSLPSTPHGGPISSSLPP